MQGNVDDNNRAGDDRARGNGQGTCNFSHGPRNAQKAHFSKHLSCVNCKRRGLREQIMPSPCVCAFASVPRAKPCPAQARQPCCAAQRQRARGGVRDLLRA